MLGSTARRALLTEHIAVSLGWMGAAAAYVACTCSSSPGDEETFARNALVPMALATGVALAVGTR